MNEAVTRIVGFQRRVMWRKRLLSLQDELVLAATIGGLIAAGATLVLRLRPIGLAPRTAIIAGMALSFAAALTRWFLTRARESDAAFAIDESLDLDDRAATSRLIIERGGPLRAVEEALIEDTAAKLADHRAASVAPFRMRRWHALPLLSLAGLVAALMIPPRSLPVAEALAAERVDIEKAGEQLEQTAAEVEEALPPGAETATLAKEQAEVGREFRRSPATRAEALRRLSALEERIRQRHDDLSSRHADEIVNLADRQLGGALSKLSASRSRKSDPNSDQLPVSADRPPGASKRSPSKEPRTSPTNSNTASSQVKAGESRPTNPPKEAPTVGARPETGGAEATPPSEAQPRERPPEPVSGKGNHRIGSTQPDSTGQTTELAKEPGASADRKAGDLEGEKTSDQSGAERQGGDQSPSEPPSGALEALKAVPNSMAGQAAKALPKLSEELLKKAGELRANELTPADIEKLRKAAESLSRDLARIAQSKELQQALQEMARQVRPEQIEQVARELGNQENLKQEFEAAARLLSENQQAKQIVAGLAGPIARMRDERRQPGDGRLGGGQNHDGNRASPSTQANGGVSPEADSDRRLAGQGRQSNLKGELQPRSRGEYLYLQSKAGDGAARAPYSSAYPRYRREAERSVQRSKVPPNLRSVVRKYFDAINPDAKR